MADFTANGRIRILSDINWSKDYRDTRFFNNISEQTSYMLNKPALYDTTGNSYFLQNRPYIAVEKNAETLWNAKYIMFQNVNMGTKWFYAFVDRIEMRAAETTFIYYTIDVMQTWMFDAKPIQAFVERRHWGIEQKGDLFFAGEDIGTGESYVTVAEDTVDSYQTGVFLLVSSVDITESKGTFDDPTLCGASGGVFNKLSTCCDYYIIDQFYGSTIYEFMSELQNYPWITKGFISLTIIPTFLLNGLTITPVGVADSSLTVGKIVDGENSAPITASYSTNIFSKYPNGYMAKMYMYPFSFIEISGQNGSILTIKPQFVNNSVISLMRSTSLSANPQIKYYIEGYEGLGEGYDCAVSIKDFPLCPVQDISYQQVLATERRNYDLNFDSQKANYTFGFMDRVSQLFSGDIIGAISGSVKDAYNTNTSLQKLNINMQNADITPPSVSGNAGGTGFNYSTGKSGIKVRYRMVSEENRKMISDYWNLRGYAIKRVEIINPNRMTRFDYIKTNDCHVVGNIPNDDLVLIENIYDTGITFWHDDNIGNYDNNVGKA